MPDMIPATHIAALVQKRVAEAEGNLGKVVAYGSSERELEAAKRSLTGALELLALIVPQAAPLTRQPDDLIARAYGGRTPVVAAEPVASICAASAEAQAAAYSVRPAEARAELLQAQADVAQQKATAATLDTDATLDATPWQDSIAQNPGKHNF
jgi:hypothetical protein